MEFDTNPHRCGSHRTETPTPGTCSPVETKHKEGEGVWLQQMHPRDVQLTLKSAAAVNTKAPKVLCSYLAAEAMEALPSPCAVPSAWVPVGQDRGGCPHSSSEKISDSVKYKLKGPACLSISGSHGKHQTHVNSSHKSMPPTLIKHSIEDTGLSCTKGSLG